MFDPERILAIAGLGIAAAAAVFTLLQVAIAWRIERRREQPVVVAYWGNGRGAVYLRNEGAGTAFNLTFGIESNGDQHPYVAISSAKDDEGDVPRALPPGRRLPEKNTEHFAIPALRGRDDDSTNDVYWCQYQNPFGSSFKTRNPVDASKPFTIRRVRLVRLR